MNDLMGSREEMWNKRLKECMDRNNLTQDSFAEALSRKYGMKKNISQKTVSRWLNVGSKIKSGKIGFPKFESIILIADFFNVDVGYLIGEIDEDTFVMKDASSFTGLESDAIKSIRTITQPNSSSNFLFNDIRETLNLFLTSNKFSSFIVSLDDLLSINRNLKLDFETLDEVIDYSHSTEMNEKLCKYMLSESLVLLMNEIYSSPQFNNVTIENEDDHDSKPYIIHKK